VGAGAMAVQFIHQHLGGAPLIGAPRKDATAQPPAGREMVPASGSS
jgi:hypothetical protein